MKLPNKIIRRRNRARSSLPQTNRSINRSSAGFKVSSVKPLSLRAVSKKLNGTPSIRNGILTMYCSSYSPSIIEALEIPDVYTSRLRLLSCVCKRVDGLYHYKIRLKLI